MEAAHIQAWQGTFWRKQHLLNSSQLVKVGLGGNLAPRRLFHAWADSRLHILTTSFCSLEGAGNRGRESVNLSLRDQGEPKPFPSHRKYSRGNDLALCHTSFSQSQFNASQWFLWGYWMISQTRWTDSILLHTSGSAKIHWLQEKNQLC